MGTLGGDLDFLLTKSKQLHEFHSKQKAHQSPTPSSSLFSPFLLTSHLAQDQTTVFPHLRQDSSLATSSAGQSCSRDLTLQVTTLWSWDFLSTCSNRPSKHRFALEAKTFHTQNSMTLMKTPASLHRPECRRLVNWDAPQPRSPTACAQNETIHRHLLCCPTWQQARPDLPSSPCLLASDLHTRAFEQRTLPYQGSLLYWAAAGLG